MSKDNLRSILGIVGVAIVGLLIVVGSAISFSVNVEDVIKIQSMTPVYDEESSIVVDKLNNSVVFNDRDQKIDYKVVIENTADYDVKVIDIELTTPSEKFLKYELKDLDKEEVLKAKSSKEVIVSLETFRTEGWGRNFEDELVANVKFEAIGKVDSGDKEPEKEEEKIPVVEEDKPSSEIVKPDDTEINNDVQFDESNSVEAPEVDEEQIEETEDVAPVEEKEEKSNALVIVLAVGVVALAGGAVVIFVVVKNSKAAKIMLFVLMFGSLIPMIKADNLITLSIKVLASFESQNVMKPSGWAYDAELEDFSSVGTDYWSMEVSTRIKNFYIENEINELEKYVQKYDVSQKRNGKVIAYLVDNESMCMDFDTGDEESCFDLHLQADGVIYFNENASFYFAFMPFLENIENLVGLDTSNVTNMGGMFVETAVFASKFELDLSAFDTSKVKSMELMFVSLCGECSEFTLNLGSGFDTSSVTNMSNMFAYTGLNSSNFTLDLGDKFDTSNVTNMSYMFDSVGSSNSAFTLDLGDKFDTSNVTNMEYMFHYAGYNSTKMNTSITIRNPNTTLYDSMFAATAMQDGSQITVNYTQATINLVDKMVATKSTNGNVVKGICVDCNPDIKVVTGDGTQVGDEINIGGEHFYVVSNDGTDVVLLAKYNLEVGNDCTLNLSQGLVECLPIEQPSGIQNAKALGITPVEDLSQTIKGYGLVPFSSTNYWYRNGYIVSHYGTSYPLYVYDDNASIKVYVDNYETYLEGLELDVKESRLIKYEELVTLGCDASKWTCTTSPYDWVYNTTYWSGSVRNGDYVYDVSNAGHLDYNNYYIGQVLGVRPVIVVPAYFIK